MAVFLRFQGEKKKIEKPNILQIWGLIANESKYPMAYSWYPIEDKIRSTYFRLKPIEHFGYENIHYVQRVQTTDVIYLFLFPV